MMPLAPTSHLFPYSTLFRSLRFIGDAALAIFLVGADEGEACRRALEAAREAIRRMDALNSIRKRRLRFGIALHIGDVRSEEHTSELQSPVHPVCRLLPE